MANYEKVEFVKGEYAWSVGCWSAEEDLKKKGMVLRSGAFEIDLSEIKDGDKLQFTVWKSKKKSEKWPVANITLTKITEEDESDDDLEDDLVF